MADMLVKLYELPDLTPSLQKLQKVGVEVRRPLAPEKHVVIDWVKANFNQAWASECEVTFSNRPISSFIATENGAILGFSCYNATCKDFFGPTGVLESQRGRGIGQCLLLAALHALAHDGYAYAIIGGVGPVDFYIKACNATLIPNSSPGLYKGMLKL